MTARGGRAILGIGALLFGVMLVSLLMLNRALQNSAQFQQFYAGLLAFNALGLLALIALVGANVRSLVRQLRQRVVGARLTVRMVIMFVVLSVMPALILYSFALDFLYRGVDSWFDLRVEQALEDSLELSRLALDIRMKEVLRQSEELAEEVSTTSATVLPFEIDRFRTRSGADEFTVMTRQGIIVSSGAADPDNLVPDSPDETVLLQVEQGNSYIGLDTTRNTGLSIRVVVKVPDPGINAPGRIIHALYPVDARVNNLAGSVQSAFAQYRELSYLRGQLKFSFILALTLALLFSVFAAIWAAFYFARKLAAPIRDLAEGTRAVADGDYYTSLPVPDNDELGYLVASFNAMTRKVASARDAARQSQDEAETQRQYLEAVLERLSSGVLALDTGQRLRTANISSGRILDLRIGDSIGRPFAEVCQNYPHLEPLEHLLQKHIAAGAADWQAQLTLFGPAGRQILMCRGTSIVPARERAQVHVMVFDDITALLQGQRDAAWSEVARRLAHEIKNPLTPIQLAAERLRHKYLDGSDHAQTELLERLTCTIINQVETMKDMVNAFSEYARPPLMAARAVDVNRVLQEVVDLYRNMDPKADISLDLAENLPIISADPGRLRQVFNNIINNALNASRSAARPLTLSMATCHVNQAATDYIETRIRDCGSGVDEAILATVFEPHVTTRKQGAGLGLAIVKKIVEEHGGMVSICNNSDGPGACVTIRLPVNIDRHAAGCETTATGETA